MRRIEGYQILFAIFTTLFFTFSDVDLSTLHAQNLERVEVVIRNSAYEVQGKVLTPGAAAVIVVRNLDRIEHGFISPFFQETDVQVESGGVTTFGRGIKGVHIAPGAEIRILFIPPRPGSFTFSCDLHPNMKGEVLLLSVAAA